MKRFTPFVLLLLAGCSIVPTDTGWPKPVSYWSYNAQQYRQQKRDAKEWKASQSKTNWPSMK